MDGRLIIANDHMYSFVEPRAIWGGIKQTGTDFFRKKSQTWRFPYDGSLASIMEKAIALFHGRGLPRILKK